MRAMPCRDGGWLTIFMDKVMLTEASYAPPYDVQPGEYVVLGVSDTGCGMTPEVQSRAIEPFFTTKQDGSGAGLGLSQCFGFARQSGRNVADREHRRQGHDDPPVAAGRGAEPGVIDRQAHQNDPVRRLTTAPSARWSAKSCARAGHRVIECRRWQDGAEPPAHGRVDRLSVHRHGHAERHEWRAVDDGGTRHPAGATDSAGLGVSAGGAAGYGADTG